MRTNRINNTNFQGKLVVIGKFSEKPKNCIKNTTNYMNELIQPKDYNLYLMQDYSKNQVIMSCGSENPFEKQPAVKENISINARMSKYARSAKKVTGDYEKYLAGEIEKRYELENKTNVVDDAKLFFAALALVPYLIFGILITALCPPMGDKIQEFNFEGKLYKFITKKKAL